MFRSDLYYRQWTLRSISGKHMYANYGCARINDVLKFMMDELRLFVFFSIFDFFFFVKLKGMDEFY